MSILFKKKREEFRNKLKEVDFIFKFHEFGKDKGKGKNKIEDFRREIKSWFRDRCTKLISACTRDKDKDKKVKSESRRYLGSIISACNEMIYDCSRNDEKLKTLDVFLDTIVENIHKIQDALLDAYNAKFGIFTVGAVLDDKNVKEEIRQLNSQLNNIWVYIKDKNFVERFR